MNSVIGIDVGIRNLSMCCLNKNDDVYSISLWNNYDLISEPEFLCQSLNKKGKVCNIKCTFKAKEVYTCKRHSSENSVLIKKKKVNNIKLQDIAIIVLKNIIEIYNTNKSVFDNVNTILIEKQPRVNQKMLLISNLIFGKFCELLPEKTIIRFISAGSKSKLLGIKSLKGNKNYKNRKQASIDYTLKFLKDNNMHEWLIMFENSTKRDDLSDTVAYCKTLL